MKKVLSLASTFPRWEGDSTPGFVYDLNELLSASYEMHTVVPHDKNAKTYERFGSQHVYRFKYFYPSGLQKLCYDGGILPNLRRSHLAKLQIPFLPISEYFKARELCSREKFDIVHAHWMIPQGWVGTLLKKKYKMPLVVTVHAGDVFPLRNAFFRHFARVALEACDVCTVNSSATKKAVLDVTKNIKEVRIIPMGVDVSLFSEKHYSESLRTTLGAGKSPIVLSVGRLVLKKGISYLLEAMPQIISAIPDARLVIVGDGPERAYLEGLTQRLKIHDHVSFVGMVHHSKLSTYYASSDVFVLPSIVTPQGDTEGLGVVLLEALASGTAVVGSDVGGIPDIIRAEKTGLLVSSKDVAGLAQAITRVLTDASLRKKLVTNGQEHIRENFDWHVVGQKFEDVYSSLT